MSIRLKRVQQKRTHYLLLLIAIVVFVGGLNAFAHQKHSSLTRTPGTPTSTPSIPVVSHLQPRVEVPVTTTTPEIIDNSVVVRPRPTIEASLPSKAVDSAPTIQIPIIHPPISNALPSELNSTLFGSSISLTDNLSENYYGNISGSLVSIYNQTGESITGNYSSNSTVEVGSGVLSCSGTASMTYMNLSCSNGNNLSGSVIGAQLFLSDSRGSSFSGSIIGSQVFLNGISSPTDGSYVAPIYLSGSVQTIAKITLNNGFKGSVANNQIHLTR